MINKVIVVCNRCDKTVEGLRSELGTSGFYNTENTIWTQFANPDEKIVCDICMHLDPRYTAVYGNTGAVITGK